MMVIFIYFGLLLKTIFTTFTAALEESKISEFDVLDEDSDTFELLNFTESLLMQYTVPSPTIFIMNLDNIMFETNIPKLGPSIVINEYINNTLSTIKTHHTIYLFLFSNHSMDLKEILKSFISWTNFKQETLFILHFDQFPNDDENSTFSYLQNIFDECWSIDLYNVIISYWSLEQKSLIWFNHDVFLNNTYNQTGNFNLATYTTDVNSNLNGYKLKACFYNVFPYSLVFKTDEGGILVSGSDGYSMMTTLKAMNATYKLMITSSNGSRLLNSRKDLADHVCDILFTSQFISDVANVQFLYPMAMDSWCILAPKAGLMTDVVKLMLPFSAFTWIMFMISAVCIFCISLKFLQYIYRVHDESQHTLIMLIDIFRIIVNSSMPTRKNKMSPSVKIFLMSLVFYSFIISSAYLALLVGFLLQPIYLNDMHTLDEVYESGLKVMAVKQKFLLWIDAGLGESTWITSIIIPMSDPEFKKNLHGNNLNYGYTVRRRMATYFVQLEQHYKNGNPVYHLVEECYLPVYASFAVRTGFPFQKYIDAIQLRIQEAGLTKYWDYLSQYEIKYHTTNRLAKESHHHEEALPLSLSHLQGIFIVLIIGTFLSCVVFLKEYYTVHKKRIYAFN